MENTTNIVLSAEVSPGVFQSKYGYHSVDKETFLLIKQVAKHWYKANRQFYGWLRWDRKATHNRVIRKWKRNEKGQKIGCEIVGPKPEPVFDTNVFPIQEQFLSERWNTKKELGYQGKLAKHYDPKNWRRGRYVFDLDILAAKEACYPSATPEGVKKLPPMITKAWLKMILERLEGKKTE